MSVPQSWTADFPLGIQARELKTALIGWSAYMASLLGYCMLHQWIVSASVPDVTGSVLWVLQEWGIWLLVTPFLFRTLRRCGREPGRQPHVLLCSGVFALVASLAFQVALDRWMENRGLAPTVVLYLPQYLAAFIGVVLVWRFKLRGRADAASSTPSAPHPETLSVNEGNSESLLRQADAVWPAPAAPSPGTLSINKGNGESLARKADYPETLLVSKGSGECLLRIDRIACVSAAGNYVEIYSGGELYLMRATMKQVEQLLPPSTFLRVHRSHIVNINEIVRIRPRRSGHGTIELRCGRVVGLSRSYKARLREMAFRQRERWQLPRVAADRSPIGM